MKVDVLISLRIVSLAILDWTLENNLLHSSEILFAASFQKLIDLINLDSEILAAVTCVVIKHQFECWHHIFNCTSVSEFVCECVGWCQWQREEDAAAICKLFSTCELLFIVQGFSLASAPTFSQKYYLKSEKPCIQRAAIWVDCVQSYFWCSSIMESFIYLQPLLPTNLC